MISAFHFLWAVLTCPRPPDVESTEHSGMAGVSSYRVGAAVEYSCITGTRLLRAFTPYNPLHKVCFYRGGILFHYGCTRLWNRYRINVGICIVYNV